MMENSMSSETDSSVSSEASWDDEFIDVPGEVSPEEPECLVCLERGPSVQERLAHMLAVHGFDFLQRLAARPADLDLDYARIVLVTYLRNMRHRTPDEILSAASAIAADASIWSDPALLKPINVNDPFLFEDDALPAKLKSESQELNVASESEGHVGCNAALFADQDVVTSEVTLAQENTQLRMKVKEMAKLINSLRSHQDELLYDDNSLPSTAPSTSGTPQGSPKEVEKKKDRTKEDKPYFNSYSFLDIHREMILDKERTSVYYDFLTKNQEAIRDKVILDLGCGSGVLSMFCAQAGAKLVVGIDAAERTLDLARKIARGNGFEDNRIQFVAAKIEEVDLYMRTDQTTGKSEVVKQTSGLPVPTGCQKFQCDFIVSEWMGYALLYEGMLYSVLHARDKYLSKEGSLLPNIARLNLHLADYDEILGEELDVWDEQMYGLSFKLLKPSVAAVTEKPAVEVVPAARLASSDMITFWEADLNMITARQLRELRAPFAIKNDLRANATSAVLSFEVEFRPGNKNGHPVVLSTSPTSTGTHWKQTILHLRRPVSRAQGEGDTDDRLRIPQEGSLSGHISIAPHPENSRFVVIAMELCYESYEWTLCYSVE